MSAFRAILACKRELKCLEECLGVLLRLRFELESNLKSVWLDYVELWNLWENRVLFDSEVEVSSMIESLWRDTSEVSNSRKNNCDELFNESIHLVTSESNRHSDWHTFTEFEVGDGLSGVVYLRKLSGNECEVVLEGGEVLVSARDIRTDTHVENYLLESGKLHYVLNLERLLKLWKNLRINVFLE